VPSDNRPGKNPPVLSTVGEHDQGGEATPVSEEGLTGKSTQNGKAGAENGGEVNPGRLMPTKLPRFKARKKNEPYKKVRRIWLESDFLLSDAYRKLPCGARDVLNIFLYKRRMKKIKTPAGRTNGWIIWNNGEITFHYREAKEQLGMPNKTFTASIDRLVDHGIIDITEQGSGYDRRPTKYAFSERWRKYGTSEFQNKPRRKVKTQHGFLKPKKERGGGT